MFLFWTNVLLKEINLESTELLEVGINLVVVLHVQLEMNKGGDARDIRTRESHPHQCGFHRTWSGSCWGLFRLSGRRPWRSFASWWSSSLWTWCCCLPSEHEINKRIGKGRRVSDLKKTSLNKYTIIDIDNDAVLFSHDRLLFFLGDGSFTLHWNWVCVEKNNEKRKKKSFKRESSFSREFTVKCIVILC